MLTYQIVNSKLDSLDSHSLENDIVIEQIEQELEELYEEFHLIVSLKTTLSTKKGSIHYHLKKEKEKGVLEVTYWPKTQQLWLEIHDNRSDEWNRTLIGQLAERIADVYHGEVKITE